VLAGVATATRDHMPIWGGDFERWAYMGARALEKELAPSRRERTLGSPTPPPALFDEARRTEAPISHYGAGGLAG
jgi:hypothetical protein